MRRILVCGGRDFTNRDFVFSTLDAFRLVYPTISIVIEGGARGADALAKEWAIHRGLSLTTYKADWGQHGKAAGHIRNKQMLVEGKPDCVVAFPGGAGTRNMIGQARAAGIPAFEYAP